MFANFGMDRTDPAQDKQILVKAYSAPSQLRRRVTILWARIGLSCLRRYLPLAAAAVEAVAAGRRPARQPYQLHERRPVSSRMTIPQPTRPIPRQPRIQPKPQKHS